MRITSALPPGSTVGILGGGQLARMLSLAAARLGINCHIYAPEADSPAFAVSAARTVAAYDDYAALEAFGKAVDVVTYEFENVPGETAAFLDRIVPIAPGAAALSTAQDRISEKTFISALGIPVAAGLLYPVFGWLLSPALAALAMALSSVSVIGNALRLRAVKL